MKQLWTLFIFILPFILIGQNRDLVDYQNIDYEDIKEVKGLLYMKADTSLVTGRVIRYNRKKEAKRYIFVKNGEPDKLGWVYFTDDYKRPKESVIGSVVSTAAVISGGIMEISGVPLLKPYNEGDVFQNNEMRVFLDDNKERASKTQSDMDERNDISKNLSVNREENISVYKKRYENVQSSGNENNNNVKKDGVFEKYYPNGNLEIKGKYIDGEKDGLWEEYYENSLLMSRLNFILGKKEGLYKEYHSNGQLRSIGNYKNGLVIGEWKFYNENGKLLLTENYEN